MKHWNWFEWLRAWNAEVQDPERRASFYGLDLYSLFTSINAVITYLSSVDPAMASIARRRYACLSPWEHDPAVYGRAVLSGGYRDCETAVVAMLRDMLNRRIETGSATAIAFSTRRRTLD